MHKLLLKPRFVAIDFETANNTSISACSVGIVKVENCIITNKQSFLIRPSTQKFIHSNIHGITWEHVKHSDLFGSVWNNKIVPIIKDVDYLVAHNKSFEQRVINTSLELCGIPKLTLPILCSMQLSNKILNCKVKKLTEVAKVLGIECNKHHDALNDAVVCANIMIKIIEKIK